MAKHIKEVLENNATDKTRPEIVEQIANLPAWNDKEPRRSVSFASKFCHFFIDSARFPIYDEAARETIKLHLGAKACQTDVASPYLAFCSNLQRLRQLANLQCGTEELDRYLWLTGMFKRWLKERSKGNPRVNAELQQLLEAPPPAIAGELRAMLPWALADQVTASIVT
jgi:hypothetical protein